MKKQLLAIAIATLVSINAFAANGGEGGNTTCNGTGNVNSPCNGSAGGNGGPPDNGGGGGGGGAGGNGGSATANATGGSFTATVNNAPSSTALGSSNYNTPTASVKDISATGGSASQKQKIENSGNNTGTANVVVQGDAAQERNPVSTAYAPMIVTGSDQCLVALSAGGQAIGFGFSIGSAISDPICEALKLSRQLMSMGYHAEALKLLKQADPRVAAAFQ